jgi:hypothetical protein
MTTWTCSICGLSRTANNSCCGIVMKSTDTLECERLRERLAAAKALLWEACGSAFPVDDAETHYRILVPRQWLTSARAEGGCGDAKHS